MAPRKHTHTRCLGSNAVTPSLVEQLCFLFFFGLKQLCPLVPLDDGLLVILLEGGPAETFSDSTHVFRELLRAQERALIVLIPRRGHHAIRAAYDREHDERERDENHERRWDDDFLRLEQNDGDGHHREHHRVERPADDHASLGRALCNLLGHDRRLRAVLGDHRPALLVLVEFKLSLLPQCQGFRSKILQLRASKRLRLAAPLVLREARRLFILRLLLFVRGVNVRGALFRLSVASAKTFATPFSLAVTEFVALGAPRHAAFNTACSWRPLRGINQSPRRSQATVCETCTAQSLLPEKTPEIQAEKQRERRHG
mmetsp:Transcript_58241/g.162387  ORF Transcript_58241/g.162387 Transcript_58241/m.162387 type:complete len:314 (-) Transcript_58241:128-1069(-)